MTHYAKISKGWILDGSENVMVEFVSEIFSPALGTPIHEMFHPDFIRDFLCEVDENVQVGWFKAVDGFSPELRGVNS